MKFPDNYQKIIEDNNRLMNLVKGLRHDSKCLLY